MNVADAHGISGRIRQFMESKGLSIDAFAKLLGDKPQRVKDVLRGKQRAPADMLAALATEGADVAFLLTGRQVSAPLPSQLPALRASYRLAAEAATAARKCHAEARESGASARELALEWAGIAQACKRECKRLIRLMRRTERKEARA